MNTAPTTTIKVIWPTNYNQKMGCNAFIHLDIAPQQKPGYNSLEETVIEICTTDNSHSPVTVQLLDIVQIPYSQITSLVTLASHGMEVKEFEDFLFTKYSYDKLSRKSLAIYYYKKLKA